MSDESSDSRIRIFDTTLRDGEQAPGVSFDTEDKIRIARLLDEVGVQYIEAGFPPVSEQDCESIKTISGLGLNARVTCLSRAMEKDIDLSSDCGVWGIVLEVPIGYPRLMYQFEWPEQKLYERVISSVNYAKREKGFLHALMFKYSTSSVRYEHQFGSYFFG